MKTVFTEKYVQQLSAQDKEYAVWDSEIAGFDARVTTTERKVFTLQACNQGEAAKVDPWLLPIDERQGSAGRLPEQAGFFAKRAVGQVRKTGDTAL